MFDYISIHLNILKLNRIDIYAVEAFHSVSVVSPRQ
jgi:hypothetical protein